MAYRWEAMGSYYQAQAALKTASPTTDLRALDAGDAMAYRWEAMGSYYQAQANSNLGE
jgi:hypothetical protein